MAAEFDFKIFRDRLIDMFIEFADSIFQQLQDGPNHDLQMVHTEIVKELNTMKTGKETIDNQVK